MAFVSGGIRDGAFKGIFAEKNGGARINACAILMLLPMLIRRNRWAIIASLGCLVAILLAKSATAIVLIVAGGASYWYFLTAIRLRINRSKAAFFGITLLYLLFCLFMYGNYSLLLGLLDRDPSLTDRTLIWDILEPMIQDKFISGYGFGAFWPSPAAQAFITRWSYIGNAHSGYMETLLNGGITQLIALIALLADVLIKQYRAVIGNRSPAFRASALIIIGLFIVTNYVAYIIPNYRSAEFLVFCTFALSFRHHWVTSPLPVAGHPVPPTYHQAVAQ
jgi:O-antigen ligase